MEAFTYLAIIIGAFFLALAVYLIRRKKLSSASLRASRILVGIVGAGAVIIVSLLQLLFSRQPSANQVTSAVATATAQVAATATAQVAATPPTAAIAATVAAQGTATAGAAATPPAVSTQLPPTPVPTLIIDIPQSSLDIILDAPAVMQKDVSYAIKISLVPKGKTLISGLAMEGAVATGSGTTAVGTPGVTLREAFGPGFEAPFGEAVLSSKTFDIEPDGPEKQPLDQPKVVWGWSVTPRSAGVQYLTVTIEATWTTMKGGERGPYRVGDRTFSINVKDAFVSQGHFDVGAMLTSLPAALVTALLGAGGLGALLILWMVRRRRGTVGGNADSAGGQAPVKQDVRRGKRKGGRKRP